VKLEHLKIEVLDPEPKGGQHCGITIQTVKVTHIPTGLTATCNCERGGIRNKKVALAMIEWGLAQVGWEDPQ